jgi:beta-galactosidase/beta-glucuronidase
VAVQGGGLQYRYTVNGQPEVVRGMGFNPMYQHLSPAERRARLERDFAGMAGAGVNTVLGWDPAQFDGLTLDVAAAHGLGVALPYDFDWRLDFSSTEVQAQVRSEVLDWVGRYRWHPALRMWAIGNETFHKLVPPAWCSQPPLPEQVDRARALAAFYVDLIDQVHALDPDHAVVYRASEDSYVSWLGEALATGGPRPWFIYGLNIYTPRLKEVLESWDGHGLDAAVLVSEFGPAPEERPEGYREYWAAIRERPRVVIGGAVYVWFAEGPEEVDLKFGLVDSQGRPVDGALAVIGELYRADAPSAQQGVTVARQAALGEVRWPVRLAL